MMNYYTMLRRGYEQLGTGVSLYDIYVITTLKCNLRCRHCYIEAGPERTESMPMELRKNIIEESARYKANRITFSGGEVTTEMDKFIDTLKYAKKTKTQTGYPREILVQTNALFLVGLGDDEIKKELKMLRDSGATGIDIASHDFYHGVDSDKLEKIGRIAHGVFQEGAILAERGWRGRCPDRKSQNSCSAERLAPGQKLRH